MYTVQTPYLPTLETTPSWCNLSGNIDRSACIEIRLSEVRELAGCSTFNTSRKGSRWRRPHDTHPLPHETPAHNKQGRVATGIYTISAWELHDIHQLRNPRPLAGDYRTLRANVMRASAKKPERFKTRVTRANPIAWPHDRTLPPNPNKGASRTKLIGLLEEWSQPLRIEKWIFPKRIRPAYYLICPGVNGSSHSPPSLSTCAAGRKNPSTRRCPQRCLKLFMIQCRPDELRDAEIVQLWIDSLPTQFRARQSPLIAQLLNRYGPIFQPRLLLCQRCLKLHYGNHPETARQSWRRRNNKPNTTKPQRP